MLVFVDLETTGLDATKHSVLEVACIITDDKLVEVARFESCVVGGPKSHEVDEFIRDMHTVNGLWSDIINAWKKADYNSLNDVDGKLATFIREYAVRVRIDDKGKKSMDRPQLAGNTISFDRSFMKVHLPRAHAELHYRNFDVSTLNEVARRFWPEVYKARPNNANIAHRAMADAEESLRVARYYVDALQPSTLPVGHA